MLWFGSVQFGLCSIMCLGPLSFVLFFFYFVSFRYRLTVFIAILLFCIDSMKGLIAYAQLRHFLFLYPVFFLYRQYDHHSCPIYLLLFTLLFGIALAISFKSFNCRIRYFVMDFLTTYITSVVSSRLRCFPSA